MEVLKKAVDVEVDGERLFNVFQVTYNVFDQSIAALAKQISESGGRLVIKEALANGRVFPNPPFANYKPHYQKMEKLALKYDVGIDAIALRFCLDSIPAFKVLSGASNQSQLVKNLKALSFKLMEEEVDQLKKMAVLPQDYWSERKKLAWN